MSLIKKTFVLRINNDTFDALSKWAEDEFRSVNGQIEMILDTALKEVSRKKIIPTEKDKLQKIKHN